MEPGTVVEYIDRQRITCAVVLEVKDKRLRVLNENDREVSLSAGRVAHIGNCHVDLSRGRDRAVETLRDISRRREALIDQVDIQELWEVLNSEQQWIDLATMTAFCFPDNPTGDHESAVIRAFFRDRLYFKFNPDRFHPFTEKQVERLQTQRQEAERRNRLVIQAAEWLRQVRDGHWVRPESGLNADQQTMVEILTAFYLHGSESPQAGLAKEILAAAGIADPAAIFDLMVAIGVWQENENTDLLKYEVPIEFPQPAMGQAAELVKRAMDGSLLQSTVAERLDLRHLPLITIDGQSTLDFDDALSIEKDGDGFRIGIHIVDVGHFVRKDTALDREALSRGSSIYMPDRKISMLPQSLAEDFCSLKAGAIRPAISTMLQLGPMMDLISYEIIPTLVSVHRQLSYFDVNLLVDEEPDFRLLRDAAARFHEFRMASGAVQISLPEIHVWIAETGEVSVNRVNRESPGRMLVSELMIFANWLAARFLSERETPAIFRSQPKPRERLYHGNEGNLYQHFMQRRLISRFMLGPKKAAHSGLGLDGYVTASSPIRKYSDLVTQRQLRAAIGLEPPYSEAEIEAVIRELEQPMSQVSRIQQQRLRYWILKHLEKRVGEKLEALVLVKRRKSYQVLLSDYMIECDLPLSAGLRLKPQDLIQVTLQRVNARKDVIAVFAS
jgi:exoribonuclease-2